MTRLFILPVTKRKRGNPNWGKPLQHIPVLRTEFDIQVERLGLTQVQYAHSAELRRWCEHNRNRCYVPEWLLNEWRITVEDIFTGVA